MHPSTNRASSTPAAGKSSSNTFRSHLKSNTTQSKPKPQSGGEKAMGRRIGGSYKPGPKTLLLPAVSLPSIKSEKSCSEPFESTTVNCESLNLRVKAKTDKSDSDKPPFANNWITCFKKQPKSSPVEDQTSPLNSCSESENNLKAGVHAFVINSDCCYETWADFADEDDMVSKSEDLVNETSIISWASVARLQPSSDLVDGDTFPSTGYKDPCFGIKMLAELDGFSIEELVEMINDLSSHIANDLVPSLKQ